MHIRPYHEPDEEAVVALWNVCGLVRPWNDPHKDIARKLTVKGVHVTAGAKAAIEAAGGSVEE